MKNYLAEKFYMGTGVGVGKTRINAFDNALLDAGVGNYNLVRLSSILPIQAADNQVDKVDLPLGSLLPIAYAEITSDEVGVSASAAVAIGIPKDKTKCCVIMEYESLGETKQEAVLNVTRMVEDGFREREWVIDQIIVKGISDAPAKRGDKVCAFACLAEWSDE